MDKTIACCLSVKNCEKYLSIIFKNLNSLSERFKTFYVIFVYDNCNDNSEKLLNEYKNISKFKVFVIHNENNNSKYRTIRIASSRNIYLDIVYNQIQDVDFHIVIDADDINCQVWNIDLIIHYLNIDEWDSLSFNRTYYYDIWALLYDDYKHHCWGFTHNINFNPYNHYKDFKLLKHMEKDIQQKLSYLKNNELYEVLSAFTGFAIYRTNKFYNIKYDGEYKNFKHLISEEERIETLNKFKSILNNDKLTINDNCLEHCEHLYYNVKAIQENNARIRISKDIISNHVPLYKTIAQKYTLGIGTSLTVGLIVCSLNQKQRKQKKKHLEIAALTSSVITASSLLLLDNFL